uniref:glycosyltransferase family 2 protein n=1 Tax=Prevotella sp. TaxID=59823 RepID=UPI00402922B1
MTHIDLSILLPSYNNVCVSLVQALQRQADALRGKLDKPFRYEIIVADDCSTDAACIDANRVIGDMLHCRYLRMEQNVGRAQIRNVLISESRGDYVLLIDSDLFLCDDNYLYKYATSTADVVYGGTRIGGEGFAMVDNEANTEHLKGNLRYIYEKKAEPSHRAVFRQLRPNQEISVCNLYARRDIMEAHPFDSRFKAYGYEDVLFGKRLAESGIEVTHIDNPVLINEFEPNSVFVKKTEEAILTLCRFEQDLEGYSNLKTKVTTLGRYIPLSLFRLWHRIMKNKEKRNLTGAKPSLLLFKLYKLGFFLENRKVKK